MLKVKEIRMFEVGIQLYVETSSFTSTSFCPPVSPPTLEGCPNHPISKDGQIIKCLMLGDPKFSSGICMW